MLAQWFRIPLWIRILAALLLGAVLGGVFPIIGPYVKPVGDLFLNAIKMLIIPLVVSTLITGVASISDIRALGRLGTRVFLLYLLTTAIAISIGLGIGTLLDPGAGLQLEPPAGGTPERPSLIESLVSIVPPNPIEAMANTDVLPVIVFSLLFGIGMVLVGEEAAPLARFFDAVARVMLKLTGIVMELAPFGVFALIAWVTSSVGVTALLPLAELVLAVAGACLLHMLLVYGGLIKLLTGLRLTDFFRGILDAQLVAFSTTSSAATLPVTLACATNNLGVERSTAGFVLPLGATINMDGTALYMGVAALFAAGAYGIPLGPLEYGVIVLTATLASIGSASVPAAGLIMMTIVFSAVGLPLEAIALIAGVDRILDMMRTMTNVTGDAMVSVLVSTMEGGLSADETADDGAGGAAESVAARTDPAGGGVGDVASDR